MSGKNVIADFVEEVQVKSSGYTAEYGGATGGVINVLTKSGTNNFRGNALFNSESDALRGGNRPTLRRGVLDNAIAEYVTYPEDEYSRMEPGFALGGPIARDRAWFFGAYQPAFVTTTRTANPETSENPNASVWNDVEQKQTTHFLTAQRHRADQRQAPDPRGLQQQLEQAGGQAASRGGHHVATGAAGHQRYSAQLVGVRQHGLGGHPEHVLRREGRLLQERPLQRKRARRSPLPLQPRQRGPGRGAEPVPARAELQQRVHQQQLDLRPADAPVLPDRRHLLRQPGRAAHVQGAACRSTTSGTRC